jgi:hypothetical protein
MKAKKKKKKIDDNQQLYLQIIINYLKVHFSGQFCYDYYKNNNL